MLPGHLRPFEGAEPRLHGRHSQRPFGPAGMAASAQQVSIASYLPAEFEAVGTAKSKARRLAVTAGRLGWRRNAAMLQTPSGWRLRLGPNGGFAFRNVSLDKETNWMAPADGQRFPLGGRLKSAFLGEVRLAEATRRAVCVPGAKGHPRRKPRRVIADRAHGSDPLRQVLKRRAIELSALY